MISKLKKMVDAGLEITTGKSAFDRTVERQLKKPQLAPSPEFDLVYVMPPADHQGWILDAICREIDAFVAGRTLAVPFTDQLPPASAYFYSHYGYFRDTIRTQPDVLQSQNLLFFTHPRRMWYPESELIQSMNLATSIVSMCSMFAEDLKQRGVRPELIDVSLVGADPDLFQPHTRGHGRIGFCSGYVPRKGGDRLIELVQEMPHRDFTLCGKKWQDWDRYSELRRLSNLEYVDIPYNEYPEFYESIDVFVSVSTLEGGPVPLIEAAMSNAVPVCSRTGHAPDIIEHGKNGFLFDPYSPVSKVAELVEKAFELDEDIRSSVEHLTWQRFSQHIQSIAGIRPEVHSTTSRTEAV